MNAVLLLDATIALLLITTIVYCWKLSRKIAAIHEGRQELNTFIADFNTAITRAEFNISQLKSLGEETDVNLREHIQKARFLANDLSFLMDKGESVADTLEDFITGSRKVTSSQIGRSSSRNITDSKKASVAQMARNIKERGNSHIVKEEKMSPSKKQALDTALSQIAARKNVTPTPSPQSTEQNTGAEALIKNSNGVKTGTPFDGRRIAESLKGSD